ncbi:hypothetical protein DPMN_043164 [Dreissena polymorpha]|uniref:Uncharacterized protein n=1 Tax=Dreissena polymorpha TaxID=45954 RepID=A0A9D4D3D8_DREPO|nr:hypothetical protein DPMN_043164 [Dreissena polymorpha]
MFFTKFHDNWAKNVTSRTIFELVRHINKTNVLIIFHKDWAKIVTSRVFTRKTAPPTGGHVFQRTGTTFELNQQINKTDNKTKYHEDWTLNVTSTVFEFDRDMIGTNLLTKFHEDRTINVASRVFTNKCGGADGRRTDGRRTKTEIRKTAPSPWQQRNKSSAKFHENWAKNVTSRVFIEKKAPPTGGHVFSPIWTIFELVR